MIVIITDKDDDNDDYNGIDGDNGNYGDISDYYYGDNGNYDEAGYGNGNEDKTNASRHKTCRSHFA